MATKKYPTGTKIRFIGSYFDCAGKVGRVVGIVNKSPLIYLPESECVSCFSTGRVPATVQCNWYDIELLVEKGEQLLFSFME